MDEDKLHYDERLRLEALAQAVVYAGGQGLGGLGYVVEAAVRFEQFLREGASAPSPVEGA